MAAGRRTVIGWVGLGVVVLFAPWAVWSSVRVAQAERPGLECTQRVYEFGEVEGEAVVEHAFVLENRGGEEIRGLAAMPDCGCMTADVVEEKVAAGGTAHVQVRMEVQSYHGAMEKKVYVRAEEGKAVTLVMRGVVK